MIRQTLRRLPLLVALSGGAFLVSGCGSDPVRGEGRAEQQPKWVHQGGAAFKDKAFYGVGVASNISSISLRRNTADAQGRAELAKIFSTRVTSLIKNYEASTTDGDKEAAEAHREEATKAFTEMELSGAQVVDRFYDLDSKTQYSLARLDPEAFDAQLDQMAKLSTRAKEVIRANARRAFDELDRESDRRAEKAE